MTKINKFSFLFTNKKTMKIKFSAFCFNSISLKNFLCKIFFFLLVAHKCKFFFYSSCLMLLCVCKIYNKNFFLTQTQMKYFFFLFLLTNFNLNSIFYQTFALFCWNFQILLSILSSFCVCLIWNNFLKCLSRLFFFACVPHTKFFFSFLTFLYNECTYHY